MTHVGLSWVGPMLVKSNWA